MKFEVGDTVRLLHSGEEGVVVEILGKEMLKVEVDGMDFPVFEDQLEYPYFERFTEMRKAKKRKKKVAGENIPREKTKTLKRKESGMFLSLLPVYGAAEEDVVTSLKIYLINETGSSYDFHCKEYLKNELNFELKSQAMPFSRLYLKDFPFENLNDHPRFLFVFTPCEPSTDMLPSFSYTLKLKARQVINKIAGIEDRQKAMFSYTLFEKYPLKTDKQDEYWEVIRPAHRIDYFNKNQTPAQDEAPYEIDLHIEKLTDDYRGMSSSDMLLLQISTLHSALDKAIAHRQYSMVVIHGIGKGVLKKEVHAILEHIPEVKRFVNQHDFRYGFGATEIFFEYNT